MNGKFISIIFSTFRNFKLSTGCTCIVFEILCHVAVGISSTDDSITMFHSSGNSRFGNAAISIKTGNPNFTTGNGNIFQFSIALNSKITSGDIGSQNRIGNLDNISSQLANVQSAFAGNGESTVVDDLVGFEGNSSGVTFPIGTVESDRTGVGHNTDRFHITAVRHEQGTIGSKGDVVFGSRSCRICKHNFGVVFYGQFSCLGISVSRNNISITAADTDSITLITISPVMVAGNERSVCQNDFSNSTHLILSVIPGRGKGKVIAISAQERFIIHRSISHIQCIGIKRCTIQCRHASVCN